MDDMATDQESAARASVRWEFVDQGPLGNTHQNILEDYPEEGLNYCSQGLGGLPCCSVGLAVAVAC